MFMTCLYRAHECEITTLYHVVYRTICSCTTPICIHMILCMQNGHIGTNHCREAVHYVH